MCLLTKTTFVMELKKFETVIYSNLISLLDEIKEVQPVDKSGIYFTKIQIGNMIIEGKVEKITMNEFQQVRATVTALKKNGKPAQVQNLSVETDNPQVATAEVSTENPNEIIVKSVEGFGDSPVAVLVTVTADADLGEGIRNITKVGSVTVTPGEAESLELKFGEPEDKA